MKKIFEKVVSITLGIISLFFVILMLVTAFGALTSADFDNSIVQALLICLAVIFVVLTIMSIVAAFQDNEKLSSVILFKNKASATKATISVIKKTAKRACKNLPEAKISKVQILADENGNVRLKVDAKLTTDDTTAVVTKVRAILIDTFDSIFGIEFASIDFRIIKSKNSYVPSEEAIEKKVEELKATIELNKPESDPIEITDSADIIGIIPQGGENVEDLAPDGADEANNNDNTAAEQEEVISEEPKAEAEEIEAEAEEQEETSEEAPETEAADELPDTAEEEENK